MARTRYVNRTILSTEAEVKTLNIETDEIGSVVVPVQGEYTDRKDKALVKAVKKGFEALNLGEDIEFVAITDLHTKTQLYRMLESQFMALAEVKEVEGEEEGEDEE